MYAVNLTDVHLGVVGEKVAELGGYVRLMDSEVEADSVKFLQELGKIKLVKTLAEIDSPAPVSKLVIEDTSTQAGSLTPPPRKVKKATTEPEQEAVIV